jgi:hypothetical protein
MRLISRVSWLLLCTLALQACGSVGSPSSDAGAGGTTADAGGGAGGGGGGAVGGAGGHSDAASSDATDVAPPADASDAPPADAASESAACPNEGIACNPDGNVCRIGAIACPDGGAATCVERAQATAGTDCGGGSFCAAGACGNFKTCKEIKAAATSAPSGVYVIDPAAAGPGARPSAYCDMVTDQGGWTLVGYAAQAVLGGHLTVANGTFNPATRSGSANLNALPIARVSAEMAFSWSATGQPTGGIASYDRAAKFPVPSPSTTTLDPGTTAVINCTAAGYTQVAVTCLSGTNCGLPTNMYTRTAGVGACYGNAYGLVLNTGTNMSCDWSIDTQAFRAVYVQATSTPSVSGCAGVVPDPGASASLQVPSTIAIWLK